MQTYKLCHLVRMLKNKTDSLFNDDKNNYKVYEKLFAFAGFFYSFTIPPPCKKCTVKLSKT